MTGLHRSSLGGFGFDSRTCLPVRASPEANGAQGLESREVTLCAFFFGHFCLSELSVTISEMYRTALLCIVVAIWPKCFSQNPFDNIKWSGRAARVGKQEVRDGPLPRWNWMGHLSLCSPQVPLSPEGGGVSWWPCPGLRCPLVTVEILQDAGGCQAECQGGAVTAQMPACPRPRRSGTEPGESPAGLSLV